MMCLSETFVVASRDEQDVEGNTLGLQDLRFLSKIQLESVPVLVIWCIFLLNCCETLIISCINFDSVTEPHTPDVMLTSPEAQNQPHTTVSRTRADDPVVTTVATTSAQSQAVVTRPATRPQTLNLTSNLRPAMQNLQLTSGMAPQLQTQNLSRTTVNLLSYGLNLTPYGQGPTPQARYSTPGDGNTIKMPALDQGTVGIGMGFSVGRRSAAGGRGSADVGATGVQQKDGVDKSSGMACVIAAAGNNS